MTGPLPFKPKKLARKDLLWLQPWPEGATQECRKRLDRLETLQKTRQRPWNNSFDPDFPPNIASIGAVGGSCGDAAHGITKDCSDFNHWVPMPKVARTSPARVSVFKRVGAQWRDIEQGELATCYFLAALASLAYARPDLIEDLFVSKDLWAQGIYTTRWLVNEEETLILVDALIPASKSNVPYFVGPSSTGEFWAVILEKAWAKIHGSFHAVEYGFWPMPMMAMTRAPVRTRYHKNNIPALIKDLLSEYYNYEDFHQTEIRELWPHMVSATNKRQPMSASTEGSYGKSSKYGLAKNHQYSVFRVFEREGARWVELFNPWNRAGTEKGRLFTMKFEDYYDGFFATDFAELIPGYFPTSKKIQRGQQNKWSHFNFPIRNVPRGEPVFVSLVWPGHRMVHPCPMIDPDVTFQVVRTDASGSHTSDVFKGKRDGTIINSLTAEVNAGPGNYHVMAHVVFDTDNYINDLFVSVYAPEHVHITEVGTVAQGDRFVYHNWGTYIAQYVDGELEMKSEADSRNYWRTERGGAENLTMGRKAMAYWHGPLDTLPLWTGFVSLQMEDDKHIFINAGGPDGGTNMIRAQLKPIPGSRDWWTCQHEHMSVCGEDCCCDGVQWSQEAQACKPV